MTAAAVNCHRGFSHATRNRNVYPRPICVSTLVNVHSVPRDQLEIRKMPRNTSTADRTTACASIRPNDWPLALRLASEKAKAVPTRNMNDGWIKSHSEQPTHGTWSV